MNKMDESDLLRFLEAEAAAAYHHVSGDLAAEREKGLRAYMREPYGTEMEGRSQVVASDVFDAVEGMLPDLVEVFTSTDKAVVFDPVGPEDEEGAEQATNARSKHGGFLVVAVCIARPVLANVHLFAGEGKPIINWDLLKRSELRFRAGTWFLSKCAPKKYGEKIEETVIHEPAKPIEKTATADILKLVK